MDINCKECVQFGVCSYEPHGKECQEMRQCDFCYNHAIGDNLYEICDWDNGLGFERIGEIKYCPICGAELEK